MSPFEEVLERGYDSVDSDDDEGRGIEDAFAHRFGSEDGSDHDDWADVSDSDVGNALSDFAPLVPAAQ